MKKFATALVSVLAVVVLALTMAACSKVDGKTYAFESVEVNGEVVSEGMVYETFKGTELKFEDGKVYAIKDGVEGPAFDYTQKGKTVTAGNEEYKVDGKKLIYEETEGDTTLKITYKKK